ncbi:hypothetical protein ACRE_064910 [Hapsidospora chrysogenum ATCC 11550]|uniref:Uncharacterized protein n=1 Tax=Hapsidospora chrysogenum (strain ATCC 11550 / CBS 779.69 / DSM 880 / IAM 14645 / JCM 23072 / IMI 49137) TaxID=857340 RepID=A0A086T098_HAPC1|nr:hypothetical protein ACRE_064910 [Hapsidospora chrysogenum ATCC 11550]
MSDASSPANNQLPTPPNSPPAAAPAVRPAHTQGSDNDGGFKIQFHGFPPFKPKTTIMGELRDYIVPKFSPIAACFQTKPPSRDEHNRLDLWHSGLFCVADWKSFLQGF